MNRKRNFSHKSQVKLRMKKKGIQKSPIRYPFGDRLVALKVNQFSALMVISEDLQLLGDNCYVLRIFCLFKNSKSHIVYFMLLTEQSSVSY